MSRTIELPDRVYTKLVEAAKQSGTTPADWIAAQLPKKGVNGQPKAKNPSDPEIAAADAALWQQQATSLGRATGIDNDSIDADLARAYGGDILEPRKPAEQ